MMGELVVMEMFWFSRVAAVFGEAMEELFEFFLLLVVDFMELLLFLFFGWSMDIGLFVIGEVVSLMSEKELFLEWCLF